MKFKTLFNQNSLLIFYFCLIGWSAKSQSLQFSNDAHITLENSTELQLSNFTLEAWIKIEGNGTATSTGSGGAGNIIPIITKGRAEAENVAADVNFFLGYHPNTNQLIADFEDANSVNHPVISNSVLGNDWTHVAATYQISTGLWNLYINGVLDKTLDLGDNYMPQMESLVAPAIGTSLNSNNAPAGFFVGKMDEIRIWNIARTTTEITDNFNKEIATETGLAGRWSLNEGNGTIVNNSLNASPDGTIVGSATWSNDVPDLENISSNTNSLFFSQFKYASLENDISLNLTDFTLEAWIHIESEGGATSTGSGGIGDIIPIISKGRAEAENAAADVNFFLGYQTSTKKLVADFEDQNSQNHPAFGNHILEDACWTHVAATYESATGTWKLFVNGQLDQTTSLSGSFFPQKDSQVKVGIGTSYNTLGERSGFFKGNIDEPRIWNITRTEAEIAADFNAEIGFAGGLVGHWGFNEGTGNVINNSVIGGINGTAGGTIAWDIGYSICLPPTGPNNAPDLPHSRSPENFNQVYSTNGSVNLCATADDIDGDNLRVRFYGRKKHDNTFTENQNSKSIRTTTNTFIKVADSPSLQLTDFTLEAWIKIEGNGKVTSTGSGGIGDIVPIISKGRAEAEYPAADVNYFLGYQKSTNQLVADFEDLSSTNHPVFSKSTLSGDWTHVAASYEVATSTWKLYINGNLDQVTKLDGSFTPQSGSQANIGFGSALNSSDEAVGFLKGRIDEVRIWNIARTEEAINGNFNQELENGNGLVGRWKIEETNNNTIANSITGSPDGLIIGIPAWRTGFPTLTTNPDPNKKFSIIWLPDTQRYVEEPIVPGTGTPDIFVSQTDWIAANREANNIVYVGHLGDCVENGDDYPVEWDRASDAVYRLEDPTITGLIEGIPYGVSVGNHDQSPWRDPNGTTIGYNEKFGIDHFWQKPYYGGHYGVNNDNHYQLFNASGVDFLVISFEFDDTQGLIAPGGALDWAENLFQIYPDRRVIVMSHSVLDDDSQFSLPGVRIYDRLKKYSNFFLLIGGHFNGLDGEARRSDVFEGNTVHTILNNYQAREHGGNGRLRIFEFHPALNKIGVKTYSPYTDTFEEDESSEFELSVDLNNFTLIKELVDVPAGASVCGDWFNLEINQNYEWYVEVFDGEDITTSPIWNFSPSSIPVFNIVNLSDQLNLEAFRYTKEVRLNWKTLSEFNNSGFAIESSNDKNNWETIGWIEGNGILQISQNFEFIDTRSLRGEGKIYYRLKQISFDETFKYSNVASVLFDGMQIFPNPAISTISITGVDLDAVELVTIYNQSGTKVLENSFGNGTFDVSKFTHGIYSLEVKIGKRKVRKKFIIVEE